MRFAFIIKLLVLVYRLFMLNGYILLVHSAICCLVALFATLVAHNLATWLLVLLLVLLIGWFGLLSALIVVLVLALAVVTLVVVTLVVVTLVVVVLLWIAIIVEYAC